MKTHVVWSCVTGLIAEYFLIAGVNHYPAPACAAYRQVLYVVALRSVNAPVSGFQHEWPICIFNTDNRINYCAVIIVLLLLFCSWTFLYFWSFSSVHKDKVFYLKRNKNEGKDLGVLCYFVLVYFTPTLSHSSWEHFTTCNNESPLSFHFSCSCCQTHLKFIYKGGCLGQLPTYPL